MATAGTSEAAHEYPMVSVAGVAAKVDLVASGFFSATSDVGRDPQTRCGRLLDLNYT
jgi:hypothetical protein